jgi:ribulose-5-phosphate 4-epimerase/fuculose-1-phosphate aldolase
VVDLGEHVAMILRNHGLLAVGATIREAFITIYWLERACQAQVFAMNTKCSTPADQVVRLTNERYKPGQRRRIGELEWAGLLRLLERRYPGFRD